LEIKGVKDVVVDEINNKFDISSDVNNSQIIDGKNSIMSIKINLIIDYNLNCR
jgi:hypothetical protein